MQCDAVTEEQHLARRQAADFRAGDDAFSSAHSEFRNTPAGEKAKGILQASFCDSSKVNITPGHVQTVDSGGPLSSAVRRRVSSCSSISSISAAPANDSALPSCSRASAARVSGSAPK